MLEGPFAYIRTLVQRQKDGSQIDSIIVIVDVEGKKLRRMFQNKS